MDKSVFSHLRTLKTWHSSHLLLRILLRPRAAAAPAVQHWSLSPTHRGHTAANPPHDRHTDRLTVCRCMNPAPYTMHAGSANKDENAHEFYVPHFYILSDILRASSSYFSTDSRYTWHRSQDLLWSIRPVSDLHSAQKNSVLLCSVTGFLIFGVKHSKNMTWSKISLIIW